MRPYFDNIRGRPSFALLPAMLRPSSRGTIRLRSSDPRDDPLIDPKYLSHPDDVVKVVEAMKLALEIGESDVFRRRFNSRLYPVPIPGCEGHPFRSDRYLECAAKTLTLTIYHPVGTCKMVEPGADADRQGVVDTELRVLGGVSGLRVVDASVMPDIVSGNTNAPVVMIAERAADLIRFGRALLPEAA